VLLRYHWSVLVSFALFLFGVPFQFHSFSKNASPKSLPFFEFLGTESLLLPVFSHRLKKKFRHLWQNFCGNKKRNKKHLFVDYLFLKEILSEREISSLEEGEQSRCSLCIECHFYFMRMAPLKMISYIFQIQRAFIPRKKWEGSFFQVNL
jgi:hypothetical protein